MSAGISAWPISNHLLISGLSSKKGWSMFDLIPTGSWVQTLISSSLWKIYCSLWPDQRNM